MSTPTEQFENHKIHKEVEKLNETIDAIKKMGVPAEAHGEFSEIEHFAGMLTASLNVISGPLVPNSFLEEMNRSCGSINASLKRFLAGDPRHSIQQAIGHTKQQLQYSNSLGLLFALPKTEDNIAASIRAAKTQAEQISETLSSQSTTMAAYTAELESAAKSAKDSADIFQKTEIEPLKQELMGDIESIKRDAEEKAEKILNENIIKHGNEAKEIIIRMKEQETTITNRAISSIYDENQENLENEASKIHKTAIKFSLAAATIAALLILFDYFGNKIEPSIGSYLGRLTLVFIFIGIAGYQFAIASQKRREAKKYRQTAILALSLNGYMATMNKEEKEAFRMLVGLRLFTPDDYSDNTDERAAFIKPLTDAIKKRIDSGKDTPNS